MQRPKTRSAAPSGGIGPSIRSRRFAELALGIGVWAVTMTWQDTLSANGDAYTPLELLGSLALGLVVGRWWALPLSAIIGPALHLSTDSSAADLPTAVSVAVTALTAHLLPTALGLATRRAMDRA